MSNLIPVFQGNINQESNQLVDARLLPITKFLVIAFLRTRHLTLLTQDVI